MSPRLSRAASRLSRGPRRTISLRGNPWAPVLLTRSERHELDALEHAACSCALRDIVRAGLPDGLAALEDGLAMTLLESWEARTGKVLNRTRQHLAERGVRSMAEVDAYLETLGAELGPEMAAEVKEAMRAAMEGAYSIGRSNVFDGLPGNVLLDVTDTRAQDWLTENHTFWVGQHYDQHISGAIADAVREKVIEQGFSPAFAGRALMASLGHELGTRGSETYWRGVAMNATTTATNFGRVASFEQADVRRVRAVNPLDRRTSKVCQYLHGAIWEIGPVVGQRDAMMEAATPEAVKAVHRWTTPEEVKRIGGPAGGASADTAALARAGIVLAPYHFHCRTFMVAEEFGALRPLL